MAHMVPHRLKALRKEANEVQEDLAAVIEKDRAMISNFERGLIDPMLDDLIKIARHYKVSPDYLLGWSDARLPVKGEQPGNQLDERALEAAFRRVLRESGGGLQPARRKRAGAANTPKRAREPNDRAP
jgi:transcriptional regulator with XRE-family HTH domain